MPATMYNTLLGREAGHRPLSGGQFSGDDVIPADNPMTSADGSSFALRPMSQVPICLDHRGRQLRPVSGGEFGPIFGPTVNNIVRDRECVLVVTGSSINPHDDPTCPVDNVVAQTLFRWHVRPRH